MNALALYIRYALRSFARGRTRSVFGAFCVAVGVASVVALGLVGGNFQDKVTGDARQQNRGDVSVWAPSRYFDAKDYRYFASLKTQGKVDDYTSLLNLDAMLKTPTGDQNDVNIGSLYAVEPQKFPFYDTIKADEPAGVPLARLLTHPNDAVVGHDTYDSLHLR